MYFWFLKLYMRGSSIFPGVGVKGGGGSETNYSIFTIGFNSEISGSRAPSSTPLDPHFLHN